MNDYARNYRILGVPENCSLDALKAARRRLVKTWHPDRFAAGGAMKHQAEERIRDINAAFEHLIDHYKKFGALPVPSANTIAAASPTATDRPPNDAEAGSPVDSFRSGFTPPPRQQYTSTAIRTILILAVLLIGTEAGRVVFTQDGQTIDTSSLDPTIPDSPILSGKPSLPVVPNLFTIGSTFGEVYAAQGAPAAIEKDVWRYGKSSVYFADGVVTSWEEDPENPLKTTLPVGSAPHVPETFTVGSTKAKVRALEGTPLVETATLWDYGLSKVHFRDGLVFDWESSPMRPLKARRP
ncbi:MAG TPA: J domain-containing protein [Burkholderiales bacterium]